MLVLEENQVLRENVDTLHKRILHLQKSHIQESMFETSFYFKLH